MQLLRLRRRLELARRGHKLLKDKLDGLVQRFFQIKNNYLELRSSLEPELSKIFLQSIFAGALSLSPELITASAKAEVTTTFTNIMGIKIPRYQLQLTGTPAYNEIKASVELGEALTAFTKQLPRLVELAAQSRSLQLLAEQIIETRRRVNALEYILIPELERTVNLIRLKLAEFERSRTVTLLKIKDLTTGNL